MVEKISILETTIRDGSYTIDFQFTARDTAIIAGALENAGFRMIEIDLEFVESIRPEPSGKQRLVISKVKIDF